MPPSWVKDEDIWEKAKAEADKSDADDYYAVVTTIYQNMGGKKKPKKKSSIDTIAVVRHEDGKYVLYTQDMSKVLGKHDTKEEAEAQERAIEVAKNSSVSQRDVEVLDVLAKRLHAAGLVDEAHRACRMRDRLASLRKVEADGPLDPAAYEPDVFETQSEDDIVEGEGDAIFEYIRRLNGIGNPTNKDSVGRFITWLSQFVDSGMDIFDLLESNPDFRRRMKAADPQEYQDYMGLLKEDRAVAKEPLVSASP